MRIVLILGLLALVATPVVADEVYVPDNQATVGNGNVIPFWAEWSPIMGSIRYQALYFASKLGSKGFTVKDIAFATLWTGDLKATQMQIRISHYPASTLVATMDLNIPSPVTVFNGPITWNTTNNTWSSMGLTGGFTWNGVDNIVVDIRYQGGTTSGTGTRGGGRYVSNAIPRNWAYNNYNATTRSGTDTIAGLKTRFTVDLVSITPSGKPTPGGTITFLLSAPGDANLPYQAGTSLGTGPIPVDTRQLNLSPDALLFASAGGLLPAVFVNYGGTLDGSGQAQAKLNIPAIPLLVGVRLHTAFVTVKVGAPSNIQSISPPASFTIQT